MNRRQKIIVSVTGIFLVLLILVGLTYAYFLTRIDGNNAEKSISVTTADLAVKYEDNEPTIVSKTLIKPDTVIGTKEFDVRNAGNATTNYSIVIDNVENNFVNTDDLEYVLKRGEDIVATGTIKRMEAQIILSNISIDVNELQEYSFTVTYKESGEDQSIDMDKKLNLRLNIRRVTEWEKAPEGTLLAAIKRDNEVVDALTTPGKSLSGYKYKETIYKGYISEANGVGAPINDDSYYTYAPAYKFDSLSGTYSLVNPTTVLGKDLTKEILLNNYIDQLGLSELPTFDENTRFDSILKAISESEVEGRYYFDEYRGGSTEIDEAVLSSTEDDYGTSYYYRGNVENNYVTFSNMCWRIVRVQGDGTIKLVLADELHPCSEDTAANDDGTFSGYSSLNEKSSYINGATTYAYNSNNSVRYAKEDGGLIPDILSTWMNREGFVIDATKLANTEWCNDVSIDHKEFYDANNNIIDGTDDTLIEYTIYYYTPYERFIDKANSNPTLRCNIEGLDNATSIKIVSNIGLLTADEIAFAGAVKGEFNYKYYLLKNSNLRRHQWWTMTPYLNDSDVYGEVFRTSSSGLGSETVDNSTKTYIRPAIVLKSDVTITSGNGEQATPYVIN